MYDVTIKLISLLYEIDTESKNNLIYTSYGEIPVKTLWTLYNDNPYLDRFSHLAVFYDITILLDEINLIITCYPSLNDNVIQLLKGIGK